MVGRTFPGQATALADIDGPLLKTFCARVAAIAKNGPAAADPPAARSA